MQIKLRYDATIVLGVLGYETVTSSLQSFIASESSFLHGSKSHTDASGVIHIHINLHATATGTHWQIFKWSAGKEHAISIYINSKLLFSISSNAESPKD